MRRDIVFTAEAAAPPASYSQAVRAGGLVFVSGTGPFDAITGAVVGDTIQEQTRQCLANIAAILKAAGSSMERIANTTCVLRDEDDLAGLNAEWMQWFPADPPARQGAKMPFHHPTMRISIAVIAEA